jgi:Flp pilus assembly protein TadG
MVEFALIAPVLIFLMLSVPVFGLIMRSYIIVTGAARDAARAGAMFEVDNRYGVATQVAVDEVRANLEEGPGGEYFQGAADVVVQRNGDELSVTVSYRQPTFVPFLGNLIGAERMPDKILLRSTAIFRVEGS